MEAKLLLICPSERQPVRWLREARPLAVAPLLGAGLVEYWLSYLASAGAKEVLVLAHDRPNQVRDLVGNGARWGLNAGVLSESRELTPAEALLKYGGLINASRPQDAIIVLDHFPGFPAGSLFNSCGGWFESVLAWAGRAITPDRVGVHELQPGVWTGMHCHIGAGVQIHPPCWLGRNVSIGPEVAIGPEAIIEDGSVIEAGAAIRRSYVAPHTFVGKFARLAGSIACGGSLIDLESGSLTEVPDAFLLCALQTAPRLRGRSLLARLSDLCARNKGEAEWLWKQLLTNKEG